MMQSVIFPSTFLERGAKVLKKKVLFSPFCIKRFLKAIVFSYKKVTTFFLVYESQHFYSINVGFLFIPILKIINMLNNYFQPDKMPNNENKAINEWIQKNGLMFSVMGTIPQTKSYNQYLRQ